MSLTLHEVYDRVRGLAWRPDSELRDALSKLFDELRVAVEDEDTGNGETALVRHASPEPDSASAETALTAELEEHRLLAEELKLRLHLINKQKDDLESALHGSRAECGELRGERDRATADALAARGETFSKLIDREIELRLQPDMGEDEVQRVAQLLNEKNVALNVLQCHKDARAVVVAQEVVDSLHAAQLILGIKDQQTWTFALPTKMALFYLEVVAAAWIRSVDARYNEIMSKHRVADENEDV